MAQKKQPKIKKEAQNEVKSVKKQPETNIGKQKADTLSAYYFRSLLVAVAFFAACWFVIVNNYTDMAEWETLLRRNQAKEQLNSEDTRRLMAGDAYRRSSDFKWFHNYKWTYHNLLNKNLKIQSDLDTLDMDGRQLYKNKSDYKFVSMIKEKTPDNAVILMPDRLDLVIPKNFPGDTPLFNMLNDKAWCYYFLYPRKLVYDEADSKDSLDGMSNFRKDPDFEENRKKVSHVVIVYGNGYQKLPDPVDKQEAYTVLPINKPE